MRFRITYTNSFKELKTIVIEEDTYFDALGKAKAMFGNNIVSVEELDKPANKDYAVNEYGDDYYHYDDDYGF